MSHSYWVCHREPVAGKVQLGGGVRDFLSVDLLFVLRERSSAVKLQKLWTASKTLAVAFASSYNNKRKTRRTSPALEVEKRESSTGRQTTDGEGETEFGLSVSDPIRSTGGVHPDGSSGDISAMQPAISHVCLGSPCSDRFVFLRSIQGILPFCELCSNHTF